MPLTVEVITGLWFSINVSWFSFAHSKRVYIIAAPMLASTCSSSLVRISCFVSAELQKTVLESQSFRTSGVSQSLATHRSVFAIQELHVTTAFYNIDVSRNDGICAKLRGTYILLLKNASRDIFGAVSGYISGHVTSRIKALVSSSSPICGTALKLKVRQTLKISDAKKT